MRQREHNREDTEGRKLVETGHRIHPKVNIGCLDLSLDASLGDLMKTSKFEREVGDSSRSREPN